MAVGSLAVRVSANTSQYIKGMRGTKGPADSLANRMGKVTRVAAQMTAGLAAAGAGLAAHLTRKGLEAVDAQAKLARQLDGTIDGLRGLQLAGEDAGVSTGVMNSALERFSARLGEAERGTGTAVEALDRLGLSAQDMVGLDVDERMALISDRVQELGLSGAQTADMLRQFGIRNREIVNLMRQGGDAIRNARTEVDELGLSLNGVDAAKVEAANDAMSRIGTITEGIAQQLAVQFAPILEGIADLIMDASKEAGGLGSMVERAVDIMITGAGWAANAFRGLQVVFKGIVLAGHEMQAAVMKVISTLANAWAGVFDRMMGGVQGVIDAVNKIPGVDIPTGGIDRVREAVDAGTNALDRMSESARATANHSRREFNKLATAEMPLDSMERWVEGVRDRSQAAAEAAAAADVSGAMLGDPAEFDEQAAELEEKQREHLERRLEMIRESMMTEKELREMEHEQKLEELAEALEKELITERHYDDLKEQLEQQHMDEMNRIRKDGLSEMERFTQQSFRNQAQEISGQLVNITQGVARHNDTMAKINKRAGQAQALINTWRGVSESLANYPMPIAGVMAAAHLATGMQAVRAIGRGGKGGLSPSQATTPATPTASVGGGSGGGNGGGSGEGGRGGNNFNINLHGDNFSGEGVIGLIDQLNDAIGDGHQLNARMA